MNALATYLKAVGKHIDSGFDLHDAAVEFVPHFNGMTGTQQFDVRDALVVLVAKKKGIPTQTTTMGARKGRPTFERGSAGLSMVNYYMVKIERGNVEKSSTTSNQVDKVANAAKRIKKEYTAAERKRLIKLLSE